MDEDAKEQQKIKEQRKALFIIGCNLLADAAKRDFFEVTPQIFESLTQTLSLCIKQTDEKETK
ncbi:MAG: hypothetical protein QXP04_03900 [Candidatus Nanoarchaeia archaeon]|nr:hypothetical protein [Candidatus Jingweiarchaeum tengchongense]